MIFHICCIKFIPSFSYLSIGDYLVYGYRLNIKEIRQKLTDNFEWKKKLKVFFWKILKILQKITKKSKVWIY